MALVTFIIPTIGRSTLSRSVESLLAQTNPNWLAIVIFDGIKSTLKDPDPRISILELDKKLGVQQNSAGNVRNKGMERATTEWLAFLDDDDTVAPEYVQYLVEDCSKADTILYRMTNYKARISPKVNSPTFSCGDMGISFAMKKILFDQGCRFIPCNCEDYKLLAHIRDKKHKILMSGVVVYFVRLPPQKAIRHCADKLLT